MGIMITYGSYVKKETNLVKAVNRLRFSTQSSPSWPA